MAEDKRSRNPLTPSEAALARAIYLAIRNASSQISVERLAKIIGSLDPDALRRLLDAITIYGDSAKIESQLFLAIEVGGVDAVRQIKDLGAKIAIPAFLPQRVQILNPKPMANMDFTKIPVWASPKPPVVEFTLSFDKTNPNSVAYASRRAGQLVTSIDGLTRRAIQDIITEAFTQQIDYRTTARRIRNIVGLHPRWAKAVTKFEEDEIKRLTRMKFSEERARRTASERAERYADRLIRARASMIARTEINMAEQAGRYEGWQQAFKAGFIDPSSMKMWMTAQDERTCDICGPLDGEVVEWNGVFSIGYETPGFVHPHCRCTMVILPPERGTR